MLQYTLFSPNRQSAKTLYSSVSNIIVVCEFYPFQIEDIMQSVFQKINLRFPFRLFVSDMATGDSFFMML